MSHLINHLCALGFVVTILGAGGAAAFIYASKVAAIPLFFAVRAV